VDHLRAGWRMGQPPGYGGDGFTYADIEPEQGKTLFESIEQSDLPADETYILHRSTHSFAVLNVFPYNSGHLMVLPRLAATSIDALNQAQFVDLWEQVRQASIAVKAALHPDGLNIGVNEGVAGGGSVPDHLHVHIVPRWRTDTNFITTAASARVLPVSLAETWARLRAHWPLEPVGSEL